MPHPPDIAVLPVALGADSSARLGNPRFSHSHPGCAAAGLSPPEQELQQRHWHLEGQSDIGSAIVPGSASYDAARRQYTIQSAGYNIWYTRDEFRYLWKKMSGNVSLAANISYPDPAGYGDRKAALVIRQDLEDDSKEALVALHGAGMIHLAQRPEKGARVNDVEYRIGSRGGRKGGATPDSLVTVAAQRIGMEKRGDSFALYVSLDGEAMHQFGPPIRLHIQGPFYVGIGFCSHLPDKSDSAVLSNVLLENAAGRVH